MSGVRAIALAVAAWLIGCGGTSSSHVRDTAYVEILRLQISKVRYAIDETRDTIARSSGAPYLPELYLRLAELMSEEARYHYRVAAEREQGSREALHVPQVRLLKEQAIGIYSSVLRNYPSSPIRDRLLFNSAHEHRELGNFDDMRSLLEQLIEEHTDSPRTQEALLIMGDYHFDRNELTESRSYYGRIVARDEISRVSALARYKLAWVWVNLGDCERALRTFETALDVAKDAYAESEATPHHEENESEAHEDGTEDTDETSGSASASSQEESADPAGQAIDVRRAALVDLVYCYSQERRRGEAVRYLRERAHDHASYVAALERLARRYGVMDEAAGALEVVRELLLLGPTNEDRLEDARQLHAALRGTNDYERVGADVDLMLGVLTRFTSRGNVDAERRESLQNEFEVYARDILTRAQDRIGRQPPAERLAYARAVADGYGVYLDVFPETDQSANMRLNAGDVLAAAGAHYDAGQAALRASSGLEGERRRGVLYDAVVRFQATLDRERGSQSVAERSVARGALRHAGRELLRFPLEADQERQVKFAIAESLYDEGSFLRAIDRLTAVAYEYPGSDESSAAVRLVLDSYNTLNDYQGLVAAGQRFLAESSPVAETMREEIVPVVRAAEQRTLDEVSLAAAGGEGGDLTPLLDFARRNEGSELGERALLNAFIAARAVGDVGQLYELGQEIADKYPSSEQLPGLLATLGQMAVGRFEVERALQFLRRAAEAGHPQRIQLLSAAAQLHEAVGQTSDAQTLYLEAIDGSNARARAEPLEKLARLLERKGDARELLRVLQPYADDGNPEILARVGLATVAVGEIEEAEGILQQVLGAGAAAPPAALSRAHYGMGEVLRNTVSTYPELSDPMLVEEYITVVDVTQQTYLNAVSNGGPDIAGMALGRLAQLLRDAADRLENTSVGAELDEANRQALQEAVTARVANLRATADQAVEACANQAWQANAFPPVIRGCLAGRPSESVLPTFDELRPRRRSGDAIPAELLERLREDPEDVDALEEIGEHFLDEGDPYSARLALESMAEQGGGATGTNLLGIARHGVGDIAGALEAFAEAAQSNLAAAKKNLVFVLREQRLREAAEAADERFRARRGGGRLLPGARERE